MKEFVKDILSVILLTIKKSNNLTERKCFSDLIPNILKIAKLSDGKNVANEICSLYLDESNDESKFISGYICYNLSYNIPDIFKKLYNIAIPLMYIARFDENEKVFKIFKSNWKEISIAGTKFIIREYFKEIIAMCYKFLDHSSWKIKKQGTFKFFFNNYSKNYNKGAMAIKELTEILLDDENFDEFNKFRIEILNLLSKLLPGQVW
jgi:hypothetical protein